MKEKQASITKSIIIGFQLAVLIPLFIVGTISLVISNFNLKTALISQNKLISQALVAQVKEYLKHPFDDLESIKMVIESLLYIDDQTINSLLKGITENHSFFIKTQIVNQNGFVENVYPFTSEFIGIDMSGMELFSILNTGQSSHWSSVFLSPQLNQPVTSLSLPINDKILTGYLSLTEFEDLIKTLEISEKGFAGIIDQTGTYIAHSNPTVVKRRERDPHYTKYSEIAAENLVNFYLNYQDDEKYCSVYLIENLNWTIIVAQSTSEFFNPLISQVFLLLLFTLSVLVIAWFIAVRKAQFLNQAFNKFIAQADEISSGNYEVDINIDSYSEFIKLAISFELMTKSIKSREKKIRDMHDELEEKVAERTKELYLSLETLQNTQVKLIESEKMASLGNLVAGVAHEINTPVGIGITNSSYIDDLTESTKNKLINDTLKKSELEKYLNETQSASVSILSSLKKAADLIQSFKLVSVDQTSDNIRAFNIYEYMQEILMSLSNELKKLNHNIEINCPKDLIITSYPGAFYQIITNLIMNAVIHGFENIERGNIQIIFKRENRNFELRFIDDGRGMEENVVANIFEPFYTTKRGSGGTGLGLHIVFNLVTQKLKGQIKCISSLNKGTEFLIQCPVMLSESSNNKV